ncbi:hypothetical protein SDC9_138024 [bioreactor metagenome]|jgi:peptidoglycan/xylan/chitin deacetylase (PgdA/CDA1 family)|uniref:NodB homology domain-containing protein n=1 Tax=bioreactor metagenome TaxID=1076179 RepID=A0A645DNQ1_9ZZZZ
MPLIGGPDKQGSVACVKSKGGIIRGPSGSKVLSLVFTGHSYAEGGDTILDELRKHHAKAGFFFTGVFLDNPEFTPLLKRIIREGHYLGPHSDQHLLYLPWGGSNELLVTQDQFRQDLSANIDKIVRLGVPRKRIKWFLPPYEHYNEVIANWSREMGLGLINYTPGTRSNADYTGEAEKNFVSSDTIYRSILAYEEKAGLNGFILLLHAGAGPGRKDKFAARFGELLNELSGRGYRFQRVDKLVSGCKEA